MSDFDFGDAVEGAIENRQNTAGFIFAQGARNQRSAQLQVLERQLEVDNKRAMTEEERLSVERRRLKIEEERLAVEKDAKISAEEQANEIRFLRGVMVDMGADLAAIKRTASSMVSGRKDQAITLRVAYVQVLLKLIGDRSHVLCELGDLKEFQRLGEAFTEVARECHQKGLSPGDSLQRVVDEIENLDQWGVEAKTLLDRGRKMLSSDLFREGSFRAGLTRLASIRAELEDFIKTFDGDAERISLQLPLFCFVGQSLNSSIGVIWELLHENRPSAEWFNPLHESIKELGRTKKWVEEARAQLVKIGPLEALVRADTNDLRVAFEALKRGDPQEARNFSARPDHERFNDPLWEELELTLKKMESAYANVMKAWDPFGRGRAIQYLRVKVLWANVTDDSEWGRELNAIELKARHHKLICYIGVSVIVGVIILLSLAHLGNNALDTARKKAEVKAQAIAAKKEAEENAKAENLAEEKEAEEKAEYLQTLKAAADQGSATAQLSLGKIYYEGDGVSRDEAKASDLLQQAVVNGNKLALTYLEKLAGDGNSRYQLQLGMMFSEGIGVEKDDKKAAEWTQKAAAQGDNAAKMLLGSFYLGGRGVKADGIEAYKWFLLSGGGESAKKLIAEMEEALSWAQIQEGRRRAARDRRN